MRKQQANVAKQRFLLAAAILMWTSLLTQVSKVAALALLSSVGLLVLISLHAPSRFDSLKMADFKQDFLMGKAIIVGHDPYKPSHELGAEFGIGDPLWRHPSPHPPSLAILITPLAFLPYSWAMLMWLLLSEVCLLISLRILLSSKGFALFIYFLIALVWYPISSELATGQLMIVMLVLITSAWLFLRSERDVESGIFTGLALAVKPIAWPLVIYFLLKRRFRAALSACAVFVGTNLIAAAFIGFNSLFAYYFRVGSHVASIYVGETFNYSVFSIGQRLFSGTKPLFETKVEAEPLFNAPSLAVVASALVAVALLLVVFWRVFRSRDLDRAFGGLICLFVIISPTVWWFYFVLLLIPIRIVWLTGSFRSRIAVLFCVIAPYVPNLVQPLFGSVVSFWIGLITLTPLLAVVLLMISVLWGRNTVKAEAVSAL